MEIAKEINRIFPDVVVYRENQEQGFQEPSFYIYEIVANSSDEIMHQQMRTHLYCLMYFPESKSDNPGVKEQCESARQTLLDAFDFLPDVSLKILDKEARIESGALNFTFKLRYKVREEREFNPMEHLKETGGLKYG